MRIVPSRVRPKKFRKKWDELQKLCADKKTWPDAIRAADQLLDKALKKKHMKGKSMGERIVSAQRLISDNDAVWYSHNLRKKLVEEEGLKLTKTQVKKCLVGFGRALKDLGALENGQTNE